MIKVAMCDDESAICKVYSQNIINTCKQLQLEITMKAYSDGKKLLCEHERERYELVFLDIDMPGLSGFEVAKEIKRIKNETVIVFVTNEEQLVFESFHYSPFRFIRKPFFQEEIKEVVTAFAELYKKKNGTHMWQCVGGQVITLKNKDIYYIESNKHKVIVYSKQMNITVNGKISDLEMAFKDLGFVRTHIGYLVNMDYIFIINKTEITLTGQQKIPMSRHRAEEVKCIYQNFLRSGN